jgi:hypothetical protein
LVRGVDAMAKSLRSRKFPPPRFRVGDRVRPLYIWEGTIGEVVEDRGNLGVGGERIYTVHLVIDPWSDEVTTEFPESSLELAPEESS